MSVFAVAAGAAVGSATAALANSTGAYYHDALRPLARELRAERITRPEMSRYAWGVSRHFILFIAAPFCLLTGAVVSHMLFLPSEIAAIRLRQRAFACLAGALLGALAVLGTIAGHDLLDRAHLDIFRYVDRLVEPVLWLYPLVPIVAATKMRTPYLVGGLTAGAAGAAAGIASLTGHDGLAAVAATGAGTAVLLLFHVARAPRQPSVELAPTPAATHIRRSLPMLLVVGAGLGGLAALHREAGDPLGALLITSGHTADAVAVAVLMFVAFWPLVAASSVASDSYCTQGTADVIPAAGYLLGPPVAIAAAAGALVMGLEVALRHRSVRLVLARPVLSEIAAATRDAIGDVTLLALLIGGLTLAAAAGGAIGFVVVAAAWLLNEQAGAPITRFAVAPAAALVVAVGAEAWRAIS